MELSHPDHPERRRGKSRAALTMIEHIRAAERERCAKIAEYLAKGQALEIGGKTLLLGSMTTGECAAQEATATAIAAAIRNKETAR